MGTVVPRTQLHTCDLDPDDFAIKAGKVVVKGGFAGPYQLTHGTIGGYTNQSGKPELVWAGGTEAEPACVWVVYPDGTHVKIKWPLPFEEEYCEAVKECFLDDLNQGGGELEKYLITEMDGPTWTILSVHYGEGQVVDFSGDGGSDLIDLMGHLNLSPNLPDGWLWTIESGVLVLNVPYGTGVTLVEMPGGEEQTFTAPSIPGSPPSSLTGPLTTALAGPLDTVINQYNSLLVTYTGLLGSSLGSSTNDNHAAVEAEYSSYSTATVRWTHVLGIPYISYKDPVNGWYHKSLWGEFNCAGNSSLGVNLTNGGAFDASLFDSVYTTTGINTSANWPIGVIGVRVKLILNKSSGTAGTASIIGTAKFETDASSEGNVVVSINHYTGTDTAISVAEGVVMKPNNQVVGHANRLQFRLLRGDTSGGYTLNYAVKSLIF